MNAGKLSRRVAIRSYTATQNEYGEQVVTATTISSMVWVKKDELQGKEWFASKQNLSNVEVRYYMRYLDGVKPSMTLVDNSLNYNIESVINADDRNRELIVMCSKVTT